ncbi:helix-hairpin-helix domain-containing protein [Bacillus solimangrovi]|uniref:Helix-hairpin-helix DNA-binding motif class 1 domain-containing protein n=1 Tax=Bacillus solimangrovi TaxID=1305675 RepID=A0A1E5LHW4_9BACI|nr:helix-hairpin-helix domain-containing protein [Bacillus solimangrovi]OEH93679.1 hypothetical protein BFG57_11600 [Bacillus solimangrovi]
MRRKYLQEHKKWLLIIIASIIFCLGLLVYRPVQDDDLPEELFIDEKESETNREEDITHTIIVDIKGAVMNPGVYEVVNDARVVDGIQMAGGFKEKADESQINLAQKLVDEMVIFVPEEGEVLIEQSFKENGGKININRTDVEDLQQLSGIGPSKAKAIVDYRDQNGEFKNIESILDVAGIGEGTFSKIQDEITVR